ncbi:MAG: ATP-dependent RecD-like DNA helicase [Lachnospiraceae bacterium]|nr:ATP-dependent RecD-like DNA helicase [Lachnospiraceae bacterium]
MSSDAKIIEGYVKKIHFRNKDNGYTVLVLETKYGDWTCVGNFSMVSEGQYLELTGVEYDNPTYMETQFKVFSYVEKSPEDELGLERYLGSGMIKGVGEALAKRIVKKFKLDTFRIIEEEPERLAEVKGISSKKALDIATQFMEVKDMRDAMVFLAKYNISSHYAVKIYEEYGDKLYSIIKENPYRLASDINGIGFRTADEIAKSIGIEPDSSYRVCAGMEYTINDSLSDGYTYLPKAEFIKKAADFLQMQEDSSILENAFDTLKESSKIIVKDDESEGYRVYSPTLYHCERNVASKIVRINNAFSDSENDTIPNEKKTIKDIEKSLGVEFDELQRRAILETIKHGVTIITGGPGTGKTTIINAIIRYFKMQGMDMLLAAPTGRAAKRMKEATGCEAVTIHRLLEITGDPSSDRHFKFERDKYNPLETDVVIIDETSMVDILIMSSLLDAVAEGTRLILVGDVNQLPSVGPGNVLKDLIASDAFAVVKLNKIYRQGEGSRIVTNAHKINAGEKIPLDNNSKDFFLIPRTNPLEVASEVLGLVRDRMPKYTGVKPSEIQVLSPMKKGEAGVAALNQLLQEKLNPDINGKNSKVSGKNVFREGDKVMQIRNNYKLEWTLEDETGYTIDTGTGVFNGDMGVITHISEYSEELTVEFDEGHKVIYPFSFLDELDLAYSITIHKSQGSEYPVVIIPITSGPYMLYTRNLLYTAVTRAKKCVVIVGDMNAVDRMIANNNERKRYSGLKEAVIEFKGE